MKKSIISVFLIFVMLLVGCTPPSSSDLVTALNAVSDASSVAVVVTAGLAAMGKVSPDVANQVAVYATGVSEAVTTSVAELNSNDTNPVKIAAITAAFAKVAAPAIGNAPEVKAAIDAVSVAVKIFLNRLSSPATLKLAKAAPTAKLELSKGDKVVVKNIQKKIAETKAAAEKLKM